MTPYRTSERFHSDAFFCCGCNARCQHTTAELKTSGEYFADFARIGNKSMVVVVCSNCGYKSYDLYEPITDKETHSTKYNFYRLYPVAIPADIPQPNNDMPEGIKNLYNEAALIFDLSPRSAAVLLRLCVQHLLQACGYKGSIHKMLKDAKEIGTDMDLITMMDACREIGNYSAHEEPELSQEKIKNTRLLFKALNIIVRHYQTWEKEKKEVASQLAPTSSPNNNPS